MAEWDIVAESMDGKKLLLGEAKWSAKTYRTRSLATEVRTLVSKPIPVLPAKYKRLDVVRALFVPDIAAISRAPATVNGIFSLGSAASAISDSLKVETSRRTTPVLSSSPFGR